MGIVTKQGTRKKFKVVNSIRNHKPRITQIIETQNTTTRNKVKMLSPVRDSFDNYKVTLDISANTGINRSSYQRCSIKKMLLKIFQNSRPATLLVKRLWHKCFSVNFAKILRKTFLQKIFISDVFLIDRLPFQDLTHCILHRERKIKQSQMK